MKILSYILYLTKMFEKSFLTLLGAGGGGLFWTGITRPAIKIERLSFVTFPSYTQRPL